MIVAKPISSKEPDLLVGNEQKTLIIKDLSGAVLASFKPDGAGWTHDQLLAIDIHSMAPEGWDAYLADDWIGSSEI
ncbi:MULTISPECIES: hypothetical protein [Serratia]|uniref:Uncharacterized protein n=2 Tax=Serratia marcescens TaxID=615 RepID=A0ABD5BTH2_SERMA|nr:hypothetical protein [Serratia marcescens]MDQ9388616.1 hypothetical protein [Serratia marcescens]MDQ9405189.1 hypothetical protein [Serratia marcescens]MDQ9439857.1 hypothetical protein [Serratia marcescens]MDQ9474313.1 hypothetical protein [Serratia marcescens]MDQ9542360.1 hypothetical protein [Serratia marcescens]